MKKYFERLSKAVFMQSYKDLDPSEQKIIDSIAEQKPVAENVNESFTESLSFGQKVADQIAAFGGSWTFIGLFIAFIFLWIVANTYWFVGGSSFDPFPFILLNLGLSSLAAFQAPIIMMSQNRQAQKDRVEQKATYEINLKLEIEIMRLHEKLDSIMKKTEGE